MKISLPILTALSLALPALVLHAQDDLTREPIRPMFLEVDGERYPIQMNEAITIRGSENSTVRLVGGPLRTFQYSGIEFQYPHKMVWEADIEPEVHTWTLTGSDALIMVFDFVNQTVPHHEMVQSIAENFGEGTSIQRVEQVFGDQTLVGSQIDFQIGIQAMRQILFEVPSETGARLSLLPGCTFRGR